MKNSFFQPPEFLSLPIFGLSISQYSIKLFKLKKNKAGLVPDIFEEVPVVGVCDFLKNTETYSECDELKNSLKILKKKHKIDFVQLAIPEENTYVFRILVPRDAIKMIDDFILNNIDQYIPLTAADVFFDYKILKSGTGDNSIPVVVTAIPKIIVEKYSTLLESCGIFVISCEPETHAIARSVVSKGDKNPYIIINIDESDTNISVVEEGFVQYTQTLPVKTKDVIGGISPEISSMLRDMVNKVIIYWFTSKEQGVQNSRIENVILTGSDIQSSGLVNFFESNLNVNVSFADVWKNCFDIREFIPELSKSDSLKYAVCIGLSMFKIK